MWMVLGYPRDVAVCVCMVGICVCVMCVGGRGGGSVGKLVGEMIVRCACGWVCVCGYERRYVYIGYIREGVCQWDDVAYCHGTPMRCIVWVETVYMYRLYPLGWDDA